MTYYERDYYQELARLNRLTAERARRAGNEKKALAFEWLAKLQETMN